MTRAAGSPLLPFVVARVDAKSLRITHVIHEAEAQFIAAEWKRGYFVFAGAVRHFKGVA